MIEPFNSGASDGEGKPVVVVVRPTSFGEVFAGFPGFGKFPGFHNFPRFSGADGLPRPHQVSLDDLFGGDHEEPFTPTSNNCGLLCKVACLYQHSANTMLNVIPLNNLFQQSIN